MAELRDDQVLMAKIQLIAIAVCFSLAIGIILVPELWRYIVEIKRHHYRQSGRFPVALAKAALALTALDAGRVAQVIAGAPRFVF